MFQNSVKNVWKLSSAPNDAAVNAVSSGLSILPATAAVLCQRGYDTPERARAYINKSTVRFYDPFKLAGMREAVERIRDALVKREKIVVYGDYDVDGVTSTYILYEFLRIHSADVDYYIPDRIAEGYGVNIDTVRKLAAEGFKLMITVDNGVTAIDEIAEAKRLGLDAVVTDHHECREVLPDCPVVDPKRPDCKYPFKSLAGVGVAFKLICALESELRQTSILNATKFAMTRYGDIITLGTIADVMPLNGENRTIVTFGLKYLESPKNLGLRELMKAAGVAEDSSGAFTLKRRMNASIAAFSLAPRINAVGRLGNARVAVELFCTEYASRAREIAELLCEANRSRQDEENRILAEAEKAIVEQCRAGDRVIVISGEGWHHGVIGIVSARITEKYSMPSIVISLDGEVGKGSGRSVDGFSLADALGKCSDILLKYGGHDMAAGLSVDKSRIGEFRELINKVAIEAFGEEPPYKTIDIDMKLSYDEINLRLANELSLLEPYGTGNREPVFMSEGFEVLEVIPLSGGKHTKVIVRGGHYEFTVLFFSQKTNEFGYSTGDTIDLAYKLSINDFNNRTTVQLLAGGVSPHTKRD